MDAKTDKSSRCKTAGLYLLVLTLSVATGSIAGPWLQRFSQAMLAEAPVSTGDFGAIHQRAGKQVVLFSTSTCSWCAQTRDLLNASGIPYQDYVLDKNPEAETLYAGLKEQTVPVLLVGNSKVRGFQPEQIRALLSTLRAQKS